MEWKKDVSEIWTEVIDSDSVAIVVSGPWFEDGKEYFNLAIDKEVTYPYGKSDSSLTVMDKSVTIKMSYEERFATLEAAKAKGEELFPLFESIG